MAILAQAPIAFSSYTSVAGTSQQIVPVNAAGVTAGVPSGNLFLDSPESDLLNGVKFTVRASGWVKAHGTSQTIAPEFQVFPWNTSVAGGRTASGTATYTAVASGLLTAGDYYNFSIQQSFFGDINAETLTCFAPTVYVAGSPVTIVTVTAPVTVAFNTAEQTEPITGVNNVIDYPLASFAFAFANSVSDTTETLALTEFVLFAD